MRRHRAYSLPGSAESFVTQEFDHIDMNKQNIRHPIGTRAPRANEIAEGQIVFALESGALRLYTKYKGDLYYIVMTKV